MDLSDPDTYARIYDEHRRGVYAPRCGSCGNPAQAQDVTQDVFLASGATRRSSTRGAASSAATCASWPAAARSTCGARARPPAGRATGSSSSSPTSSRASRTARPPWPSARASAARCATRWRACPSSQREALVLAYWGGLTADEIARRAGVPLGHGQEPDPPGARAPARRSWRPPARLAAAAAPRPEHRRGRSRSRGPCEPRRHDVRTPRCAPFLLGGREGARRRARGSTPTRTSATTTPTATQADPQEILDGARRRRPRAGAALRDARARRLPRRQRRGARRVRGVGRAASSRSARVDPNAPRTRSAEAQRCLRRRRARASSCTRAATPSGCRTRSSSESSRSPPSARAPVLFHAGRGIPDLGEAVVDLAREHPGARLILAHAGISDLGLLAPAAAAAAQRPASTPRGGRSPTCSRCSRPSRPGRSSTRSDMPYGAALFASFLFLRCAGAVGLGAEALRGDGRRAAGAHGRGRAGGGPRAGAGLRRAGRPCPRAPSASRLRVDRRADGLPRRRPQPSRWRWRAWPASGPRATGRQRSSRRSPACAASAWTPSAAGPTGRAQRPRPRSRRWRWPARRTPACPPCSCDATHRSSVRRRLACEHLFDRRAPCCLRGVRGDRGTPGPPPP